MLRNLIEATSKESQLRQTVVRWFSRLYHDVRTWDNSLRDLLKSYPGIDASRQEKQAFAKRLQAFEDSLRDPHSATKNDILTRLQILAARFDTDFAWLESEDRAAFDSVRKKIDDGYACEEGLIWSAVYVVSNLYSKIELNLNEESLEQEVTEAIKQYEESADANLHELHELATNAGIVLTDITEYDSAFSKDASRVVLKTGDIDMSHDKIHIHDVVGPVNVKSQLERVAQTVRNAPTVPDREKREFAALVDELKQALESIPDTQKEDSQRVAQAAEMVAAEIAKEKPNKSFLAITTEGLKEAAKAVESIAPSVLNVITKIISLVGSLA
ncbi:MAG: hypothetical protein IH988_08135 [Planctomycetes bacterium]|nr:hypothetical protein [Planctomycetota bacterium]